MRDGVRTEWADFFDGYALEYEQNCFTKNTVAEVDFLIEELGLAPGQAVLDVGCGTGRHAIELARRGYRVTGIDVSAGMLQEAKRNATAAGVSVTWVEADARDFAFQDPFDAAICLCEGAFGLLGSTDDPIGQPQAVLRTVAGAMKPDAKCLFTVLNGYALARRHTQADVEHGVFDPLSLAERSEVSVPGGERPHLLREKAFVPTEIVLLFALAGLQVRHIWGGTAGNWGRRPIDLDEIEIMVVAERTTNEPRASSTLFTRGARHA